MSDKRGRTFWDFMVENEEFSAITGVGLMFFLIIVGLGILGFLTTP
jgi:hypothetical protein